MVEKFDVADCYRVTFGIEFGIFSLIFWFEFWDFQAFLDNKSEFLSSTIHKTMRNSSNISLIKFFFISTHVRLEVHT